MARKTRDRRFGADNTHGIGSLHAATKNNGRGCHSPAISLFLNGADETRTRDLRRDRPAF